MLLASLRLAERIVGIPEEYVGMKDCIPLYSNVMKAIKWGEKYK